jgi:hypothetical protein
MRKLRFNIASLLAVILVLGVGYAALRESSDLWESGVFAVTLAALLSSILLAVHSIESRRAFWIGFAVFGWTYLGLTLMPPIESRLITTKALKLLDSKMPSSSAEGAGILYLDYDNDGSMDLFVVNNSRQNALYRNKANGGWIKDVTAAAGSIAARFPDIMAGLSPTGSSGTTENFVRIGHPLLAIPGSLYSPLVSLRFRPPSTRTVTRRSRLPWDGDQDDRDSVANPHSYPS